MRDARYVHVRCTILIILLSISVLEVGNTSSASHVESSPELDTRVK